MSATDADIAKPHPGGRPCKLTPEVQERICARLRKGMPRERAARRAGIHDATFRRWMTAGAAAQAAYDEGDGDNEGEEARKFRTFRAAVLEAEDACVEKDLDVVDGCAAGEDPKLAFAASKWRLSYRYREDFTTRVENTGADGGPVAVAVTGKLAVALFTDEQLRDMTPEQVAAAIDALGNKLEPEER